MKVQHSELISPHGSGGGPPSNKPGSTYSAICKMLATYDKENAANMNVAGGENYIEPKACEALEKLGPLIDKFLDVRHPQGSKETKKDQEIDAVKDLRKALQEVDVVLKVSKLLNNHKGMANHPEGGNCDLIRNSMSGWIKLLSGKKSTYTIQVSTDQRINAQVAGTKLQIYPANFFATKYKIHERGDLFPVSILTHEYHHHLTQRKSPVYYDEFVAHCKQYAALGVLGKTGATIDDLNKLLLDPAGYKLQHEIDSGKAKLLSKPEDAGPDFWGDHLDNAK